MDPEPTDAPAAVYPGWVMLNNDGHSRSYFIPADAINSPVVACLSSAGKRVHASFCLAAPPGNSSLFLDWPDVRDLDELQGTEVIAAHGDSVLIQARDCSDLGSSAPFEYFVYRAGGGPPSLSLLPPCYLPMPWDRDNSLRRRRMESKDMGILRRGEDELAVAQLTVSGDSGPELCVLRSSRLRLEWETKRPSVVYAEAARGDELQQWWATDATVPIGDRFLCWVDYYSGLVLCDDVFDDAGTPVLRYVLLPGEPNHGRPKHDWQRPFKHARNIGTTAGGAVRFVSVDRRCCCGGLLESRCPRSRFSFTLTTWTLEMGSMTWSTDGVLHSDELWALPGYDGLPRVRHAFPVLCIDDDADAVCLMVDHNNVDDDADKRIWMIKVDTRSKTLLSVVRYNTARYKPTEDDDKKNDQYHRWINDESRDYFGGTGLIPSQVSKYLN